MKIGNTLMVLILLSIGFWARGVTDKPNPQVDTRPAIQLAQNFISKEEAQAESMPPDAGLIMPVNAGSPKHPATVNALKQDQGFGAVLKGWSNR